MRRRREGRGVVGDGSWELGLLDWEGGRMMDGV